MKTIEELVEFEWDAGNTEKNKKHDVRDSESEEVFQDSKKRTFRDHIHSGNEERFRILGKTNKGRLLFVVYTKRNNKLRVISARDINKKEVYLYEKTTKSTKV